VAKQFRDKTRSARSEKTVVVAFGRFQPPTSGHQLIVDKVIQVARNMGADHAMFSSRTNDPYKNPLSPRKKFHYLKTFFPDGNFVNNQKIRNPVDMLYWLADKGYDHVVLVSGEDRQGNYKMFKDFMKPGKGSTRLKLKSFRTVEAGKRDSSAGGVQGMSASKLRAAVAANDTATFTSGMPRRANKKDVKALFADLKIGMATAKPKRVRGRSSLKEGIDYIEIYSAAATRLLESDKHKRRPPTPGQTGGFSKHNTKFKTPPCKIDEDLSRWFNEKWVNTGDKKDPNPWAVCTVSVGRDDKKKYERCVKDVKKQSKTPHKRWER